jgi:hypothetical protein
LSRWRTAQSSVLTRRARNETRHPFESAIWPPLGLTVWFRNQGVSSNYFAYRWKRHRPLIVSLSTPGATGSVLRGCCKRGSDPLNSKGSDPLLQQPLRTRPSLQRSDPACRRKIRTGFGDACHPARNGTCLNPCDEFAYQAAPAGRRWHVISWCRPGVRIVETQSEQDLRRS